MFHVSAVFFLLGERGACALRVPPVDPPMIGNTDFVAIFGAKAVYFDVFMMKIKNIQMHFMYNSQHAFQKQIMHIGSRGVFMLQMHCKTLPKIKSGFHGQFRNSFLLPLLNLAGRLIGLIQTHAA